MTVAVIVSSPTLARVLANDLCAGCGLCAGVGGGAVSMTVSADGFNRPVQGEPLSAAQERQIAAACPGEIVAPWPAQGDVHPVWGPHLTVAAGYARNDDLRHHASSGGMISALAIQALAEKMVDGVIQIVADPARPTQNRTVVTTTPHEIMTASGSRYAPSSPLSDIRALLAADERRFAFIGKPCDVSALRRLIAVDPAIGARVPLILSFFCAGVPGRKGTDALLRAMGVADETDLSDFRYRGDGWPGQAKATRRDGQVARMSYADSWGGHLSKALQFRCKICPDAVGGSADIACADAWFGDDKGYPLFEEQNGRSAVIARTPTGVALLERAVASGRVALEAFALDQLDTIQPSQARRKRLIASRLAALIATGRRFPKVRGLRLTAAARRAGVVDTMRSFAGLIRRIVLAKAA